MLGPFAPTALFLFPVPSHPMSAEGDTSLTRSSASRPACMPRSPQSPALVTFAPAYHYCFNWPHLHAWNTMMWLHLLPWCQPWQPGLTGTVLIYEHQMPPLAPCSLFHYVSPVGAIQRYFLLLPKIYLSPEVMLEEGEEGKLQSLSHKNKQVKTYCPIPGGIQGQAGCGSGQPGLLVGDPAHSRGLEPDHHCGPFQPSPFCDSMMMWAELDTVFQIWPPQDGVEEDHLPQPAGHVLFNAPECLL